MTITIIILSVLAGILLLALIAAIMSALRAKSDHCHALMRIEAHSQAEQSMKEIIDRAYAPFREPTVNCAKCGKFVSMQESIPVVINKKDIAYAFYHKKCLTHE